MTIVKLRPELTDNAANTLTDAFWNDPLLTNVVAPDESKRRHAGEWFFQATTKYGIRWGEAYSNDGASGVAIWFPPGQTTISMFRMLRVGLASMPLKLGLAGMSRFAKAMSVGEKFHKAVRGPHWYLMAIGTKPELQGTGLGGGLLLSGTSQADSKGLPCYLETASESNVAFYSRRGFEVTDQTELLGFTLYGMVRQPQ
jgi:ribosomal protein S18 acetylase RimI-like enzyme